MSFLIPEEKDLFYRLYFDLLYWVNKKQKIVRGFHHLQDPGGIDPDMSLQIRDQLFDHPEWIDDFMHAHHTHNTDYTEEELDIFLSWRSGAIKGSFYVMKHLKKYSVFMTEGKEDTVRLYGITGLSQPFSDLADQSQLPLMIKAVILPFKGRVIFDGLFLSYPIRLGPGIRSELNRLYSLAKTRYGVIEHLPFDSSAPHPAAAATAAGKKPTNKPAQAKDIKYDEIAELISQFCCECLNEEFLDVCLHVLKKLSRKRPSPLSTGKTGTWACGIVYAVASNNFVFDRSQSYYMAAQDIADMFGLSKSMAQTQGAKIKKLLNMTYFAPEYVIASLRDAEHGLINTMRYYENALSLFK